MSAQHILQQWNGCRQWLLPAAARSPDGMEEGDLINELILGRAQIWPGERSAMVTQLVDQDGERLLHVLLGGGDLKELLLMHFGVASWGRAMGAGWATINGREGWARVLRAFGFVPRDGELWKALR